MCSMFIPVMLEGEWKHGPCSCGGGSLQAVRLWRYIFTVFPPSRPPHHPRSLSQLSYRRQRHKEVNTLTTANSTAELTLAEDDDDYIIHIRTLSEGGLGPASDPIRIHQLSKLPVEFLYQVTNRKLSGISSLAERKKVAVTACFNPRSDGKQKKLFPGLLSPAVAVKYVGATMFQRQKNGSI